MASINDEFADMFQDALVQVLLETDFTIPGYGAADARLVETYAGAGVLTRDSGLIVHLADGIKVYITIQAFAP